jgi:hypothetical protein
MSNEFKLSRDLKIKLTLPLANDLVWGIGVWGSQNWAIGSTYVTDIAPYAVSVRTRLGYSTEANLFAVPEVGTATIVLDGSSYDPNFDTRIRPNQPIQITVTANPDTAPVDVPLFTGFIANVATQYDAFGNTTTTLECVDVMSKILNATIANFDQTSTQDSSVAIAELLSDIQDQTGVLSVSYVTGYPISYLPIKTQANYPANEALDRVNRNENGVLVSAPDGSLTWYSRNGALISSGMTFQNTAPGSLSETDYYDVQFAKNTDQIANTITLNQITGGNTVTNSNIDSVQLYGTKAMSWDVDAFDRESLIDLAHDLVLAVPQTVPVSVSARVVDRTGYANPNLMSLEANTTAQVKYNRGSVNIAGTYTINAVEHDISTEAWFVRCELWQGV